MEAKPKRSAGAKLSEWLQKRGYSQGWLANVLGVTQAGVSNWVRGRCVPEEALRVAIADLTGINATLWLPAAEIEALSVLRGRVATAAAGVPVVGKTARSKPSTRKRRSAPVVSP